MELRQLGRGGPEVSVIGYGGWQAGGSDWGPNRSEQQVVDAVHAALDAGVTWVDTAEVYGRGVSEQLIGKALADRRDRALVFTKVAPQPSGSGLRPEQVRRALQASLERLGSDHVDLYQMHWPDDSVPIEETWGAMADLVREGLVRHIGLSNVDRARVERCQPIHPVASVQNELSMVVRGDAGAFLPWLATQGIGYLAYSPLAGGLLTGAISADTRFSEDDWRARGEELWSPDQLPRHLAYVEGLRGDAGRAGVTLTQLALRWVLAQPAVTGAIVGSRNPDHVREAAAAGSLSLDAAALAPPLPG
jgi:aryl-alcohol dehydrogenase-like predicted oxidoreductase